ncbi:MAG: peptide deformylase [Francisellaceae bacterium]|nr:peptide deformylase [Francisellaceae bacterium]MBT6206872.1 peptide deformylase [Francisellaceae bacterium]
MQTYQIHTAGDSILKEIATPVTTFSTKELDDIIKLLFYVMHDTHGAGLAAPQIGLPIRIFVYGIKDNLRYPTAIPIPNTVLINPEILTFSNEVTDFHEGCLSIPNMRGLVSRANSIEYKFQTVTGETKIKIAEDFEARVIQHEIDHLNGILFPSRMIDMSTFVYNKSVS